MILTTKQISAEATRPVRHRVLWPHIEQEKDCVIDIDEREDAIHLGAFLDDQLVAVCSLFEMHSSKIEDKKQYRLRAMASLPEVRGSGAGKMIVQEALRLVEAKGMEVLWCDARKVALGFYEKLGFERIDEWYEVPKIGPHQFMYYRF
ncbi:MAG: GNAT family N-acetyltransferase [Flavobacteriales bacterium]|nr:GNAT family N-acetyltransferase [Flavobacteriales bacterium]MDG1765305.1 GNAT family N-acetyltransferase [Flavobacteriales bacterium]